MRFKNLRVGRIVVALVAALSVLTTYGRAALAISEPPRLRTIEKTEPRHEPPPAAQVKASTKTIKAKPKAKAHDTRVAKNVKSAKRAKNAKSAKPTKPMKATKPTKPTKNDKAAKSPTPTPTPPTPPARSTRPAQKSR